MSEAKREFRTGDVVFHKPSGEQWLLAWADDVYVYPYGWPDSRAEAVDCKLLEAASDEKHAKCLAEVAESKSDRYSTRAARHHLKTLSQEPAHD